MATDTLAGSHYGRAVASPFSLAFHAASARAPREDLDDPAKTLLLQILSLQAASSPLVMDNYQVDYERGGAEFFQSVQSGVESLYQHLHAATESAVRLAGANTSPPIEVSSVASLDDHLEQHPGHRLASEVRRLRREVSLLRWVCTVRNKAVQHRQANGYIGNRAIVLTDGFALLRKPLATPPEIVRKARGLLRGLVRQYGISLDAETGEAEIITYLDFVSHGLYKLAPAQFDQARAVVVEAARHDLIVSSPFLSNLDHALAGLIGLSPEDASSPFTGTGQAREVRPRTCGER